MTTTANDEVPGCTCGHGTRMHNEYGCYEKVGSASCDDAYCHCSAVPRAVLDERRARIVEARRCTAHRRYAAARKPTSTCEACWRLWVAVTEA